MEGRRTWVVAALAALLACAQGSPPAQEPLELEYLLPEVSSLGDWRIVEGPIFHDPDTLWEYLDGGAPRYLAYGLERMIHLRYQLGEDPLSSVTADVYQMGSELGAFGIYSSIRPPAPESRPWGAEGYRSATVAAAWKGVIFVHAAADDERLVLIEAMEAIVAGVCAMVVGDVSRPSVLDPLPPENLVPNSERYVASDLLGHASLPGGVLATYEIDSLQGDLFFSELENESAAQEAVEAFLREKKRWAKISITTAGFRFEEPGGGFGTVRQAGRFVIGVQGDLPFDAHPGLLERLVERLIG